MSENDESSDAPEFVAVTPRGTRDDSEPTADSGPVADGPEGKPEPEPEPAVEPEPSVDATQPEAPEPVHDEKPPAATESEPESDTGAEPDLAQAPEASTETAPPAVPEPTASAEPAAAAATLRWTPPVLERPSATPEAAEQEAEPESAPGGDAAVSVRVAAEGMAAALAGHPTPAEVEEPTSRSVGPVAIVTAVCVVLALAAGALLAVTAHSNSNHRAVAAARTAALAAAKQETAVALTYDYRTLDADFQRAEAGMSRKFRANYAQTAASSVAPLAQKTHAITTGTVAAGGVVSATPTTARILVFANQTVENKLLNATSRLDRSVIEVTMVKENGRWVIDNLQPF
ncbi:MAG TPA: hypothetical protein VHD81_03115 [Mycobacteriales bacterium]|nr:hypothetical protein [Mycobacteriales bacterium]